MSDCVASTTTEVVLTVLQMNGRREVGGDELKAIAQANDRQVRAAISTLRRQGKLIVGNWHGYYFARNASDVYACIGELRRQAQAVLAVADAMMESAAIVFEQ